MTQKFRAPRRAFVLLALLATAVAVTAATAGAATKAASGGSSNDFIYTVNPLAQPASDDLSAPLSLKNPYCSTRHGLPTLVCYTPKDIRTAYNYPSNLDGAGQTIVIVDAIGSPTAAHDLAVFDAQFGLPSPPGGLQIVCPSGCPTWNPNNAPQADVGWAEETSLDVQWAHAMAPAAKLVLAVAPSPYGNAINSVEQKIVNDPAYAGAIVSQSFGIPEAAVIGGSNNAQILQAQRNYAAARANGMTVLASAGDNGATNGAATENAGFPASSPLVTAVGGTQGHPYYNGRGGTPLPSCSAGVPCTIGLAQVTCTTDVTPGPATSGTAVCPTTGYGGEETWNEPLFGQGATTGGAESLLFSRPAFQNGDGTGLANRTIPDLAYNASISGGVLTYLGFLGGNANGFYIFGGTSAGSPQMSAVIALADQAKGSSVGYINDKLYNLAESSSYGLLFHDVTFGNNQMIGTPFGYNAGTGYDLTTGWGTPNVANFVAALAGS